GPRRQRLREEERAYESRLFEVEPGVRLLAHCRWQPAHLSRPTLLLVHGLEGSSSSRYILGTSGKAFRAGFNVVRLNVRNCGGTEHLAPTLYHSGMSDDVARVVAELIETDGLTSLFVVGFSMGGNLVLKMAGEMSADAPRQLKGISAVSPSLDLRACAHAIEQRSNWLYQQSFVRSLHRRIRHKQKLFPDIYDTTPLRRVRTVRQFDEIYTAVHGNFRDADDYYARASALQFVPRIRVPTFILHAQDDPFVPFASFRDPALAENPCVLFLAPRYGGHVAFLADEARNEDRFWAENRVVEFCALLAEGDGG
ncbi:MAG TPA: alpha/beta fold hydrolase, partial [Pyrinomonadaceae bacterium]|nr:alpha/beta fold hydrolase [Pyrinomonadaceae bacterium]